METLNHIQEPLDSQFARMIVELDEEAGDEATSVHLEYVEKMIAQIPPGYHRGILYILNKYRYSQRPVMEKGIRLLITGSRQ